VEKNDKREKIILIFSLLFYASKPFLKILKIIVKIKLFDKTQTIQKNPFSNFVKKISLNNKGQDFIAK
jgi:hypothetical protein